MYSMALNAEQTEPHRTRWIKWMQMILIETFKIISESSSTKQEAKEKVRY